MVLRLTVGQSTGHHQQIHAFCPGFPENVGQFAGRLARGHDIVKEQDLVAGQFMAGPEPVGSFDILAALPG